jgi:hypothetical protein
MADDLVGGQKLHDVISEENYDEHSKLFGAGEEEVV